jgi:glutamate synthase (NADPH/NADH) large chain
MIADARPALEEGEKMQLTYQVRNIHRAVGTKLSYMITKRYGMTGLQPGHITVRLRGSAGQSLGAFAVQGLKLEVFGDSNDYVGKGLSGGMIVVRPAVSSPLATQANTIIGNTVLYGATAGQLFAAGQAGERFAVRNSGAEVVVEGCGSNGCEYMTGGTAVILGEVGANFAAGMTGGMAFVYDRDDSFRFRLNPENAIAQRVETAYWEDVLKRLIETHVELTQSAHAQEILLNWEREKDRFWQVVPKEMLTRLEHPVTAPEPAKILA